MVTVENLSTRLFVLFWNTWIPMVKWSGMMISLSSRTASYEYVMNTSRHAYKWVMSHVWMSHAAHVNVQWSPRAYFGRDGESLSRIYCVCVLECVRVYVCRLVSRCVSVCMAVCLYHRVSASVSVSVSVFVFLCGYICVCMPQVVHILCMFVPLPYVWYVGTCACVCEYTAPKY